MKLETYNQKSGTKKKRSLFHVSCFKFHEKGFTLIELLTAVAVIGIVSAVVLVNLNAGKKQKDIERAAQKLVLDIRKAQNYSLSPTASDVCVYGVKINSVADYFIYRNDNDGGGNCADRAHDSSISVEDPSIAIGSGVTVSNFAADMDMSFEAPEPMTYFNGLEAADTLTIALSNSSCPACVSKNVVINRFGQVEVQ